MVPNDMLKREYIAYNQGFALINTQHFFSIKKEYSKRLYEILSRFKDSTVSIHPMSIDELKGLFGLLDESGKLKKDKTSFKSNNVFMKRCIRDSILELSTNDATRHEVAFQTSSKGEKGFELIKKGNKIVSIKFLYQWKHTKQNQVKHAEQIVHDLESKRIENKQKLTADELHQLRAAYICLGDTQRVELIDQAIANTKHSLDTHSDEINLIKE